MALKFLRYDGAVNLVDRKPVGILIAVALSLVLELGIAPLDPKRLAVVAVTAFVLLAMTGFVLERFAMHRNVWLRGAAVAFAVFAPMFARVALDKFDILWTTYLISVGLGLLWVYRMFKPATGTLET